MSLRLQRSLKPRFLNPFHRDTELYESSDNDESSTAAPSTSIACVTEPSTSLGMSTCCLKNAHQPTSSLTFMGLLGKIKSQYKVWKNVKYAKRRSAMTPDFEQRDAEYYNTAVPTGDGVPEMPTRVRFSSLGSKGKRAKSQQIVRCIREAEQYCQHNKCDLDRGETCQQYDMGLCSREGCERQRYKLPRNPSQYYNYCSAPCLWKESKSLEKTKLTLLDVNNLDYFAVKDAFQSSIRMNAVVQAIYQIVYPYWVAKPFLNRRVAKRTIRRFHGTRTVQCGAASELAKGEAVVGPHNFCSLHTCGPCGIIQNGLRGGYDGQVWSGGTAATSHAYTAIFPGSTTRVMFLCDAVAARLEEAAPVREAQLILPRFLILYAAFTPY